MTKKEVVASLRKAFNMWASLLPDCEYESCNDHSEEIPPGRGANTLHVFEVTAEMAEGEEEEFP